MDFSTNHDNDEFRKEYAFRIHENLGENNGFNSAEIGIWITEFIDSRSELDKEIKKRALEFLKRAVSDLEAELKD